MLTLLNTLDAETSTMGLNQATGFIAFIPHQGHNPTTAC